MLSFTATTAIVEPAQNVISAVTPAADHVVTNVFNAPTVGNSQVANVIPNALKVSTSRSLAVKSVIIIAKLVMVSVVVLFLFSFRSVVFFSFYVFFTLLFTHVIKYQSFVFIVVVSKMCKMSPSVRKYIFYHFWNCDKIITYWWFSFKTFLRDSYEKALTTFETNYARTLRFFKKGNFVNFW